MYMSPSFGVAGGYWTVHVSGLRDALSCGVKDTMVPSPRRRVCDAAAFGSSPVNGRVCVDSREMRCWNGGGIGRRTFWSR